jgi:hypothetical protein
MMHQIRASFFLSKSSRLTPLSAVSSTPVGITVSLLPFNDFLPFLYRCYFYLWQTEISTSSSFTLPPFSSKVSACPWRIHNVLQSHRNSPAPKSWFLRYFTRSLKSPPLNSILQAAIDIHLVKKFPILWGQNVHQHLKADIWRYPESA